ncbi:hypothetical protein [Dankookia sp. P2]|uniref:hypothetical protein n=1 Tax=Dankookia sp. P2 TaxID=3423955 RepID=UPI003D666EF0
MRPQVHALRSPQTLGNSWSIIASSRTAASPASRRSAIVVPPAWSCIPSMVMRHCQMATMPVTTPACSPARSSLRPLLDVHLEEALVAALLQLHARLVGEARCGQRAAQRRTVAPVAAAVDLVIRQQTEDGAAAEEATFEMSLLIGEGDDIDRQPGPRQGEAGDHAECAVQPAGVILGFDMAAGQQMRPGAAVPAIDIANAVDRGVEPRSRPSAPSANGGFPCPPANRSAGGRRSCRRRSAVARSGRGGSGRRRSAAWCLGPG